MTAASGEPPVIQLSAVGYTYSGPPPVQALKPTDLVIRRGEHVAIMGPSGSGKSTLLNLLGLLDRPTEGKLEIDGIDLGRASERDRAAVRARHIGFVFQSFHLLPHRSAIENVMLAQVYADMPRRRRYAEAMSALERGRPGRQGARAADRAVRRRAPAGSDRAGTGQPPVAAAVR